MDQNQDSKFPFTFYLTEQEFRNLMDLCPEIRKILQSFNDGLMSYVSALICIIEILAKQVKVQSQSFIPNMN